MLLGPEPVACITTLRFRRAARARGLGARIVALMALHLTVSDQRWQSAVKLTQWTSREGLVSRILCIVLDGANTWLIPNHHQRRGSDGQVLHFVQRPTEDICTGYS